MTTTNIRFEDKLDGASILSRKLKRWGIKTKFFKKKYKNVKEHQYYLGNVKEKC